MAKYLEKYRKERRIIGVDKNKEGRQMATALFFKERGRVPTNENELRDYYKRMTHGHEFSITDAYEMAFGKINPVQAMNNLKLEKMQTFTATYGPEKSDEEGSASAGSEGLTLYLKKEYESSFKRNTNLDRESYTN